MTCWERQNHAICALIDAFEVNFACNFIFPNLNACKCKSVRIAKTPKRAWKGRRLCTQLPRKSGMPTEIGLSHSARTVSSTHIVATGKPQSPAENEKEKITWAWCRTSCGRTSRNNCKVNMLECAKMLTPLLPASFWEPRRKNLKYWKERERKRETRQQNTKQHKTTQDNTRQYKKEKRKDKTSQGKIRQDDNTRQHKTR